VSTPKSPNSGRTLLAQYLRKQGLRLADLACALVPPVRVTTVSNWLHGTRRPTLALRAAIEHATEGAVPASAWLRDAERARMAWLERRSLTCWNSS